ncbi:hypothetical protein KHG39_004429 [Salmonella enterica]|nr:hypothetical protein [Salmonella enterica]
MTFPDRAEGKAKHDLRGPGGEHAFQAGRVRQRYRHLRSHATFLQRGRTRHGIPALGQPVCNVRPAA